jgi:hypothetical protein
MTLVDLVGSPLTQVGIAATLISAVAAGITLYLRGRTRERLSAIQQSSREDRARIVADVVPMFGIDTTALTKEQRYDLAVQQLRDKHTHRTHQFLALLVAMGLSAVCTVALAWREDRTPMPPAEIHQTVHGSNATTIVIDGSHNTTKVVRGTTLEDGGK